VKCDNRYYLSHLQFPSWLFDFPLLPINRFYKISKFLKTTKHPFLGEACPELVEGKGLGDRFQ